VQGGRKGRFSKSISHWEAKIFDATTIVEETNQLLKKKEKMNKLRTKNKGRKEGTVDRI